MSLTAFEQWWALWRSQHEHADAGECVIAVRDFYEAQIAALKVERDALLAEAQERGVRLSAEFLDREADANFMPNEPAKLLLHGMASALRLNLLTPASGEPARKP